uniref:Uncharacterized protein n=1 Tax=Oryza punctata TaxID=4537 RepID=A0A0E0KMJ7_ORYPU
MGGWPRAAAERRDAEICWAGIPGPTTHVTRTSSRSAADESGDSACKLRQQAAIASNYHTVSSNQSHPDWKFYKPVRVEVNNIVMTADWLNQTSLFVND